MGGEMTQTLYAHMSKRKNIFKNISGSSKIKHVEQFA
jgi:hypothetical protein